MLNCWCITWPVGFKGLKLWNNTYYCYVVNIIRIFQYSKQSGQGTNDSYCIKFWVFEIKFLYQYSVFNCRLTNSISNGFWLTLILPTWRIWWAPNNASKWQMGFNSVFKGLSHARFEVLTAVLLQISVFWSAVGLYLSMFRRVDLPPSSRWSSPWSIAVHSPLAHSSVHTFVIYPEFS
jgi:hypothetical protein